MCTLKGLPFRKVVFCLAASLGGLTSPLVMELCIARVGEKKWVIAWESKYREDEGLQGERTLWRRIKCSTKREENHRGI